MQIKGIIFDLDGTLANTLDDIAGSMNRILRKHGYPVHIVNDYKLLVGRGLDNLVTQALPADSRDPSTVEVCLKEMMEDYDRNCVVQTHLYQGIREMAGELIKLRIKLAVFSNKSEPLTIKIVNSLLGDVPFEAVIGARQGFPRKPDPAGALLIAGQMGTSPDNIMYIGDSDVDMITAGQAGMMGVGVTWGFRSREELLINGAKKTVDKPAEIIGLLIQ